MRSEFDPDTWPEVSTLFDEALALAPEVRDAWLQGLRARNEALASQLVRLLEADADAASRHFLAALPALGPSEERSGPAPGDRVGPYALLREIGSGGMGTVWLAERSDGTLKRPVALKLPHGGHHDRAFLERFDRERDILAGLAHPNIARLYDAGVAADGRPFLALEYVDGVPITEWCDGCGLDLRGRIGLFLQVLDAVQYAHRNLVVHRDIKPSNILVDASGNAMLLDFGIAKLLETGGAPSGAGDATQLGGKPMTPRYASPEQVTDRPLTTSSDVYSLGVLLFELLCGRLPYRLADGSPFELQSAIASGFTVPPSRAADGVAAPPPGLADRRRLVRDLRGDLDAVLMKALEAHPARRYASCEAFSRDLSRYLRGEAVEARPDSTLYRTRKFVRRHRIGVGIAAIVTIAILGSLAFAVAQMRAAQRERDRAEHVSEFLLSIFKVSDPSEARGKTVTAREILDRGAAKIETTLDNEPLVRADLLLTMGEVYQSLGLYDSARPLLQKALEIRRRLLGADDYETMEALNDLATLLENQGKLEEAEPLFREALDRRRRVLGERHPDTLNAMNNLALVLQQRGRLQDAEPLFRRSLEGKRRALAAEDPDLLPPINNLAVLLHQEGKLAEAEPLAREVLEKARRLLGQDDPHTLTAIGNLALILDAEGKLPEAEASYREVLERRLRVLGADHPQTLLSHAALGECLVNRGRLPEAEDEMRLALEGFRTKLGPDHPRTLMALNGTARLELEQGRLPEAERDARASLEGRRRRLGDDHSDTIDSMRNLASILEREGRLAEAEALDAEAIERGRRALGDVNPSTLGARAGLASVRLSQGRAAEAEPILAGVLAAARASLPPNHRAIGRTLLVYGRCLTALGRYAEAESALLESRTILGASDTVHAPAAAARLADLYERWGKPDKAAEWRRQAGTGPATGP